MTGSSTAGWETEGGEVVGREDGPASDGKTGGATLNCAPAMAAKDSNAVMMIASSSLVSG